MGKLNVLRKFEKYSLKIDLLGEMKGVYFRRSVENWEDVLGRQHEDIMKHFYINCQNGEYVIWANEKNIRVIDGKVNINDNYSFRKK